MKRIAKLDERELPVVVVAGVSSGAGKTSVAEVACELLSNECATAAAKITVTHGERGCPHGGKGCNVCSSLGGDFQVITRQSVIEQADTDTARLSRAGASPVVWGITRDVALARAWKEIEKLLSNASCAVVESNTLTEHIKPALTLMVVDPTVSRKIWKPSAERLIASADLLIFNDRGTESQKDAVREEISRLRSRSKPLISVTHPRDLFADSEFKALLTELSNVKV
jgi:molybdopterin-guanine dinucleotide biosynthesis protein